MDHWRGVGQSTKFACDNMGINVDIDHSKEGMVIGDDCMDSDGTGIVLAMLTWSARTRLLLKPRPRRT